MTTVEEARKTPRELLLLAEQDSMFDINDRESCLAFLLTMQIYEEGPKTGVSGAIEWMGKSDYSLDAKDKKILHTFWKNLHKTGAIREDKIVVSKDGPDTCDIILTMLSARGFVERCGKE